MVEKPELFWGLIASMWVGNLMLLVLNLPLIGIWTRLLTVPYRLLYPTIFLTRPISLGLLLAALAMLVVMVAPAIRRKRQEVFVE